MRMWMVDPKHMCSQHLLGEHLETHMFLGSIRKGISLKGYVAKNLLEIDSLKSRHDEIAVEMGRRGFGHESDLDIAEGETLGVPRAIIDKAASRAELFRRCPRCSLGCDGFVGKALNSWVPKAPKPVDYKPVLKSKV